MAILLSVNITVWITALITTAVFLLEGNAWGIKSNDTMSLKETKDEPWVGDDRDIVKEMEIEDKVCAISFGSQTGVAEGLASLLAEASQPRFGLKTIVCDPKKLRL